MSHPGFTPRGVPGGAPDPAPAPIPAANLNMRIPQGSTEFPPELHGKTLGEAMRYYGIMREEYVQRMRGGQPTPLRGDPAPAAPAPAPAAPSPYYSRPAAPAPAPSPSPAPMGEEPITRAAIAQVVGEALKGYIGPMAATAATSIEGQMRARFRDWDTYALDVRTILDGADPQTAMNPDTWMSAYYFVKGRAMSNGAAAPAASAPAAPAPSNGIIRTPPPAVPTAEHPWFTEGPTAPNISGLGVGGPALPSPLDPAVIAAAARWGIPVEEYIQFTGGRVPPMPAPTRNP